MKILTIKRGIAKPWACLDTLQIKTRKNTFNTARVYYILWLQNNKITLSINAKGLSPGCDAFTDLIVTYNVGLGHM